MDAEAAVRALVAAINARDVGRLVDLAAPDHRFIDAHGGVVAANKLEAAWTGYFAFMPRYGVEIDQILCAGDTAAVFGQAWGVLDLARPEATAWRRPGAWRVVVAYGKVALWQVYVDTKAVFDLL
jgi:ketosteroid isomerase-like protein